MLLLIKNHLRVSHTQICFSGKPEPSSLVIPDTNPATLLTIHVTLVSAHVAPVTTRVTRVTYIAIIRGKNNQLIEENLKLLDKMHEGLIVVTEKDLAIKFANKPARRLLK